MIQCLPLKNAPLHSQLCSQTFTLWQAFCWCSSTADRCRGYVAQTGSTRRTLEPGYQLRTEKKKKPTVNVCAQLAQGELVCGSCALPVKGHLSCNRKWLTTCVCVFVPTVLCWWVSLAFVGSWPSADRLKEKKKTCSLQLLHCSDVLWPVGASRGRVEGGPDVRTSWSYASPTDLGDVTYPQGRTLVWLTVPHCPGSPLMAHCMQLGERLYSRRVLEFGNALLSS